MCEEGFRGHRRDLLEPVDVGDGRGQRRDAVAPVGADEEVEVGFERGGAEQLVAEEGTGDRIVGVATTDPLEAVVDEPGLRDERGVSFGRQLAPEQFRDEHRVLGVAVGLLGLEPDALGESDDFGRGHRPTSLTLPVPNVLGRLA